MGMVWLVEMCNMMILFFIVYFVVVFVLLFYFGNYGFWVVLNFFLLMCGIMFVVILLGKVRKMFGV